MVEELKDTVDLQEIHTMGVLVSMRNLGGSPKYGCQYYHMVHKLEGVCNPSWTYMH